MKRKLEELGFKVYPSEANFLLAKPPIRSRTLCRRLLKRGIVIKDLTLPYDTTGSRTKGGWVKWKTAVDPVDCYVSGFDASEVESRKGMVAALHFSCLDENGEERHIASCSNFDMEMRADMSGVNASGEVFLRPHWYGRVAEITGLAFSSVNYRFVHAVIKGWRPDRSRQTCKIDSAVLKKYRL